MTRFLSDSLQAPEPFFQLGLRQLELMNGKPSNDIRLTEAISLQTKAKLRALGLEPNDTTPEELYHVLQEKLIHDDKKLIANLRMRAARYISAEANVSEGLAQAIKETSETMDCFAIKSSKMKNIIRKYTPKKTMKLLGYRSVESFLKHESIVSIMSAAWFCESGSWFSQLTDQYSKLKPSDFETRSVTVFHPNNEKWLTLARSKVSERKHNLVCFREFAAITILPIPADVPSGTVTASTVLALHELNEIRACSTYLKLCQVRPDFGELVKNIVESEPRLNSKILDKPVPWHLIHQYYGKLSDELKETLFEPHIHADDMSWQAVDQALCNIVPEMHFWKGNSHLGILNNHKPLSLNILDVALNTCNHFPFEKRIARAYQHSVWNEMLLKYLNHDTVEQTVLTQLQPSLSAINIEN